MGQLRRRASDSIGLDRAVLQRDNSEGHSLLSSLAFDFDFHPRTLTMRMSMRMRMSMLHDQHLACHKPPLRPAAEAFFSPTCRRSLIPLRTPLRGLRHDLPCCARDGCSGSSTTTMTISISISSALATLQLGWPRPGMCSCSCQFLFSFLHCTSTTGGLSS